MLVSQLFALHEISVRHHRVENVYGEARYSLKATHAEGELTVSANAHSVHSGSRSIRYRLDCK